MNCFSIQWFDSSFLSHIFLSAEISTRRSLSIINFVVFSVWYKEWLWVKASMLNFSWCYEGNISFTNDAWKEAVSQPPNRASVLVASVDLQTLEMGVTFMYLSPNSTIYPIGICLLKVNNRNTSTKCEICLKLTKASFGCLYCYLWT